MITRTRVARCAIMSFTTALCLILATPAFAQAAAPSSARENVDANGVDLFLGTMNAQSFKLVMGKGEQSAQFYNFIYGAGWQNNISASIWIQGGTGNLVHVTWQGQTLDFTGTTTSGFTSLDGSGATLAYGSGLYTLTTADGTKVRYDPALSVGSTMYVNGGFALDATYANGYKVTYNYEVKTYNLKNNGPDGPEIDPQSVYRLSYTTSSSGYKTEFLYSIGSPGTNGSVFDLFYTIVSAKQTNTKSTSGTNQTITMSLDGTRTYFTVTDPMGRATVYRLASSTYLAGITRPGSTSEDVTITYTSGKVSSLINPVGTYSYAYTDASGVRTVTVTNPSSKITTYTFDIASQRITSMTDATSRTTTLQYDTSGRLTRTTMPEGNYAQHTYDGRGNVTETRNVAKSGSGLLDIVTTASYDTTCTNVAKCNQPNSTTDARGNTTDYTYDSTSGNVLTVTAPAPTTGATRPKITNTYNTVNGVSMLDTSSACRSSASCAGTSDETKTVLAYNTNGLVSSVTKKAGDNSLTATAAVGYDDIGNATSVDGPLSGSDDTTTFRYDADREQVGIVRPDPDGTGSLARAAIKKTYDAKGQLTVIELGTVTGTSDTNWAAFSSARQLNTTFDLAGRKTRSVLTASSTTYGITEYSYDTAGRSDCVTVRMNPTYWGAATAACTAETAGSNGPDRISRTTYDDAGRALTTVSAYGTSSASTDATATYNANGTTATLTDAEGNKTSYTYDGVDRLAKTTYPSTTKGAGTSNSSDYEQLSYDAGGNVTSRRLRDGNSIGYTYDNLERLTAKDLPGSELDVAYTYDLMSRPLTAATSAQTVTFTYDALGRNLTQVGPQGTATATYDAAGRRTQLTYPGGSFYVTYDYQVTGEVTAIKESGSTSLATYAYDDLGRRMSLTLGNGVVSSYGFDNVSRLTSLGLNLSGTGNDQTLGFSYNPAGQIAETTRSNDGYAWTGAANVTRAYTSNGLNQFTASGATSLGYDTRGNLTTSGGDTYTYSSENLLLTGPGSAALTYDPLLRLYQTSATGFTTTRFAYDRQDLVAEYDTSGSLLKRYVFGPGSDAPLVEYNGSGTKTYLTADERGSVVARTNSSGVATAKNSYDEYGIPGSGNAGRFGYTGQSWLPELGMQYSKARIYSPTLGRFMQTDPIGYGDGMNWYNYVGGDPVNESDPSGLSVTCTDGTVLGDSVGANGEADACAATHHGSIAEIGAGGGGGDGGGGFDPFGIFGGGSFSIGNPFASGGAGANILNYLKDRLTVKRPCGGIVAEGMSSLYRAGGITAKSGQAIAVLGLVIEGGDFTPAAPITAPGGLAVSTFGAIGVAVGSGAQVVAGSYYALHGNPYPLFNAASNLTFGLIRAPNGLQKEFMGNMLEGAEESMEKDSHPICKPAE